MAKGYAFLLFNQNVDILLFKCLIFFYKDCKISKRGNYEGKKVRTRKCTKFS